MDACRVCTHPHRSAIEAGLREDRNRGQLAWRYHVKETEISAHGGHMSPHALSSRGLHDGSGGQMARTHVHQWSHDWVMNWYTCTGCEEQFTREQTDIDDKKMT